MLFDLGEDAGVGVDGVDAEAGIALAGDVEVFPGGMDGEGAGDAFAGVVADEGEVTGIGVDFEADDGVFAGGGVAIGAVAVGDVEEAGVGGEVEVGGGDGAVEVFGEGDDVLDGFESALIGVPAPDADAGEFAFVGGIDDGFGGVEDEVPGLAGVGFFLGADAGGGIIGGDGAGGGIEAIDEDLVRFGGGDEEPLVVGGEYGGVGLGFEGEFLESGALVDAVVEFPDSGLTGAVVIAGDDGVGGIGFEVAGAEVDGGGVGLF